MEAMTGKRIGVLAVFVPVGIVVALYWVAPGLFVEPLLTRASMAPGRRDWLGRPACIGQ